MSNEFVMVPKRIDAPNISTGRPGAGSIYADAFTKERARADALASILCERDAVLREVILDLGEWSECLDTQDQVFFVGRQMTRLESAISASAEPSAPTCKSCGQVPEGQSGEYPCKACGLPTVHDEPSAPKCTYCGDTGQIMVGRSGDANDGNAPIMEPCEDCDGPSAPAEIDERGLCRHNENLEFKIHPKCMLCSGTGIVQKELFPERAGLPCDGIPF